MMPVKLRRKLVELRGMQDSLAGWQQVLGADFEEVRPQLVAVTGQKVDTYPCPETGIRLCVREHKQAKVFTGFSTGGDAGWVDDVRLGWDDVRAWELDEAELCRNENDYKKDGTSQIAVQINRMEQTLNTVHKHVRGVPQLQADLREAERLPEHYVMEMLQRIKDVLDPEEERIWIAMRNAGGVQKDAFPELQAIGIVGSLPTLNRRVTEIDIKLKAHGIQTCKGVGPKDVYRKHGGYTDNEGHEVVEEYSMVANDWREDERNRERIIKQYISTTEEERAAFREHYPDIEAEAEEYRRNE